MALLTTADQFVTCNNRLYLARFDGGTLVNRTGDFTILSGQLTGNTLGAHAAPSTIATSPGETVTTAVSGYLPIVNASTGNNYLTNVSWGITGTLDAQRLVLFDVLWRCQVSLSGIATSTINSSTWPARDVNGTTNGEGVYILLTSNTSSSSWTQGSADPTISYTNSAGVAGRTGVLPTKEGSTTVTLTSWQAKLFGLQGGDTGVRSVQSITMNSALATGSFNLIMAVRPLCVVTVGAQCSNTLTLSELGKVPLYNNTVILPTIQKGYLATEAAFSGLLSIGVSEIL
jgi:hypothetical protein